MVVAAICSTLVLMGCIACGSTSDRVAGADASPGTTDVFSQDADIAQYRQEFDSLVERTGNDALRQIIADDVVTADEMNELYRRTVNCYRDEGFVFSYDESTSGSSLGRLDGRSVDADRAAYDAADQRCRTGSGFDAIAGLYFNAARNPEHLDLAPYTVQCLIDHGLVAPSYTVAEYRADAQRRSGPYRLLDENPDGDQGRQIYQCGRDPLGKLQ